MAPDLQIDRGRPDDVDAIIAMEIDAASAYRRVPGYAWVPELPGLERTEIETAIAEGSVFIARIDARPVGFTLTHARGRDAHLREIDVLPDFARRGIGSRLLTHACTAAAHQGCSRAVLTTFCDVAFNAPWYAANGFANLDRSTFPSWLEAVWGAEERAGLHRCPRVAMGRALG